MKYYVLFSYKGKAVAGTWVAADSEGEALLNAEFKLICLVPNVQYDGMDILEKQEI